MIVYSTVLEVNGEPTLYSVYKNGQLAFLNPAQMVKNAPILYAKLSESSWQIKGTNDTQLLRQVMREIGD
jgi:hypothetical protein